MSILLAPQLIRAMKAFGIDTAALFDGSTGYLSRVPAFDGDQKTWTFSCWVFKYRVDQGTLNDYLMTAAGYSGNDGNAALYFRDDYLYTYFDSTGSAPVGAVTIKRYRDTVAYHVVWQVDAVNTTQRVWINGEELDVNSSYDPSNFLYGMNKTGITHAIGKSAWGPSDYGDFCLADVYFVDGSLTDHTHFGKTDSRTGNWVPKKRNPSVLDLGPNGFYLDFADANDLGKSGPRAANVAATLDPLALNGDKGNSTLSNGNLTFTNVNANYGYASPTFKLPSEGKVWFAYNHDTIYEGWSPNVGLVSYDADFANWAGVDNHYTEADYSVTIGADGLIRKDLAVGATYTAASVGNTRHFAIDMDTLEVWIGLDTGSGVSWHGGGDPALGTSPTETLTNSPVGYVVSISCIGGSKATFDFAGDNHSPPAGFTPLSTDSLPAVNASPVTDHFNTVLYTGNSPSNNAITGLGFQPDFVWIKCRNLVRSHAIFDSIRGVGNPLSSNSTAAEPYDPNVDLVSFDSDGFTTDDSGDVNDGTPGTYVAWCANLPNEKTSGWSGAPTITPAKEIYNADLGMSIVTYTGNGTAGATIPHSLGKKPGIIIIKKTNAAGTQWIVYHSALSATKNLYLSTTSATATLATWNNTEPTSQIITLGGSGFGVNNGSDTYVAYIFAETDYIKIGSYEGNGSTDGPMVNAGISPVWGLFKDVDGLSDWEIKDTARSPYNPAQLGLWANVSSAESPANRDQDFLATGVKNRTVGNPYNRTGGSTHIYLMIGEPTKRAALEGQHWQTHSGVTQVTSTPTNTYAMIDANQETVGAKATLSEGNLKLTTGALWCHHGMTLRLPEAGKFAWQYTFTTVGTNSIVGVCSAETSLTNFYGSGAGNPAYNVYYESAVPDIKVDGVQVQTPGSVSNGDIFEFLYDRDAGTIDVKKNGSAFGSQIISVHADNVRVFVSLYNATGQFDFGQSGYTPSDSSYKTLCTDNLPVQPGNIDDHFKTVLWTGDGTNDRAISTGARCDFVWAKTRDVTGSPRIYDNCRGADLRLLTDGTGAEATVLDEVRSLSATDGFTVDSGVNANSTTFAAWTAALPNTKTSGWSGSPTITPLKEIYNATLGMSIVTYTGNGTVGATIPHSLGKKPGVVVVKKTSAADQWQVYHTSLGATKYLILNATNAAAASSTVWNDTEPTSTLITFGSSTSINQSGGDFVAYIFAETDFCKIGSYTGNGNADGPLVNLGGSPVWSLTKRTDGGITNWTLHDSVREPYNVMDTPLQPNNNAVEGAGEATDYTANGFKIRSTGGNVNTNGGIYAYLAFVQPNGKRENPAH